MLYVSSIKNNLYGITDAEDYTEEFYSYDDVIRFSKAGLIIFGVKNNRIVKTTIDEVLSLFRFKYKDFVINLVNGLLTVEGYKGDSTGTIEIPRGIEVLDIDGSCSVTEIIIPDTVKRIGNYCFSDFYNLEKVVFNGSMSCLNVGCFYKCSKLKEIVLPKDITSIGSNCFYGCTSLVSIDIPDTVTSIESNCFYACTSLKEVNIRGIGDLRMGNCAFDYCTSLKTIRFNRKIVKG